MKVVFVADNLTTQTAGIHVYTRQFIKRTIKQYPKHSYHHITTTPYEIAGSINEIIPIKRWLPGHYRLRYFNEIPRRIRSLTGDVVIEMAHFGPFRLPDESIKRVTVVHDLTPILYPQYHDKLSVWWHTYQFGSLLQSVDAIISNSHTTRSDIVGHLDVDPNKISVCYPTVPNVSSQKTPFEYGPVQLLTVGTIEPRKNHLFILEALLEWYEEHQRDFTWVVAGAKGWKSEPFYDALKSSPIESKVLLTGHITDQQLHDMYRDSDVFLFASHYEGFGLPILEAMAYGLCVILSDTTIHHEVGGEGCMYVQSSKDLSDILNQLPIGLRHNHNVQLEHLNKAPFEVPFL